MKKKVFLYAGLVPVIVFLFFLPSLFNGFVNWDDPHDLLENPLTKDFSWKGIQTIFVVMWSGQYHRFIPLTMVLFTAEYHFFGNQAVRLSLRQCLLHSLNSLGVFVLIYLLTKRAGAALAAALLFGLHPLQVEACCLGCRGTVPGLHLFLFKFHHCLCMGNRVPLQRDTFEALSFLFFVLALLFYSQLAMSLPLILLTIDYYWQGKIGWGEVLRKSPYFLLSFYFGRLTLIAAHHVTAGSVPAFLTQHLPFLHRIDLSSEALWMYGQKFFIPHPLSCLYPMAYYSNGALLFYSVMGAVVFLFLAAFRQQDGLRISFLGLTWFLLTIAPFLHIYGVSESIIYDRYFYIPSIGILLMLIGIWEGLEAEAKVDRIPVKSFIKAAGLVWIIMIISLSYHQIRVWRDSGMLWTNFISQYPRFAGGYLNRSDYYLTIKEPRLALRDTGILLKLNPQSAAAYQNRGHAFFQLRDWQAEAEAYTKVLSLNPNFVQIYVDRGAAFFMLGRDDLALEDFNRALQKAPGEVNALFDRGMVYYYKKEYQQALADFQKVVLIDPTNDLARNKSAEIEHILTIVSPNL